MPDSIQKTIKKRFKAGDVIFEQGKPGAEMYVIETGIVELSMSAGEGKVIPLGTIGKNNFFGEMALFGNDRRTATARAVRDSTVIVINKRIMQNQLAKLPVWFNSMFKTLIERLRETDRMMIESHAADVAGGSADE